ncbi:MAG: hypothetical protein E7A86_07640, partial [Bradyrhizobium sp.]|nr:hypothetical protein [Bradyrhizobium sp.]
TVTAVVMLPLQLAATPGVVHSAFAPPVVIHADSSTTPAAAASLRFLIFESNCRPPSYAKITD